MYSEAGTTTKIKYELRTCIEHSSSASCLVSNLVAFDVHLEDLPKGPPIPPPPKNLLNNSSGDISSLNIGPPAAGDLANPLNGEDVEAEPGPNRLSGSPPNRSYFSFFSGSDRTWNALETTAIHDNYKPMPLTAQS